MDFKTKYMPVFLETVERNWPSTVRKLENPNDNLMDLGLDSLDVSSLILSLEDRFAVAISDEELEEISSVNDIAKLVFKKIS